MITRGLGGGIITMGIGGLWEEIKEVIRAIIRGGGGGGYGWSRRFLPRRKLKFPARLTIEQPAQASDLVPVLMEASVLDCPYCNFNAEDFNVIDMASHIRESHPDKLVGISKKIAKCLSLGYSDIEALILPPDETAPEKYADKPLIAAETISVRVKKVSKYG